jgi:CRP-like cAMP-binding protein
VRDRLPVVEPLQRALYLRSVPLFRGLRAEHLVAFARLMRERWVRRGTLLCAQGAASGAVQFLVAGRVRIERDRRQLRAAEAPASIGLLELLAQAPSAVTAVAATNVLALVIDGAALLDVIEDHFSIFTEIRRAIGEQMLALRDERDRGSMRQPPVVRDLGPPSPPRLGLVERLIWLSRSPVLRDLGVSVLAVLARDEDELRLREGQVLWAEGAPADFVALLVSGYVGCAGGAKGAAFRAGPGTVLGLDAAFTGIPHEHAAVARTAVVAIRLGVQSLLDVAEDHSHVAARVLAHCAGMLLELRGPLPAAPELAT